MLPPMAPNPTLRAATPGELEAHSLLTKSRMRSELIYLQGNRLAAIFVLLWLFNAFYNVIVTIMFT